MPLRQTAQTIEPRRGGNRCGVSRMLNTLTGDDLEWFRETIDSAAQATWMAEVLADEGIRISEGIIGAHRRRECKCWEQK
jgi:hypothetical protein